MHKDGHPVALAWTGVWSEAEQKHLFIGRDMTAQNELELAERRAKDMLTAVIDASPVAIVCLAPDRTVMPGHSKFSGGWGSADALACAPAFAPEPEPNMEETDGIEGTEAQPPSARPNTASAAAAARCRRLKGRETTPPMINA